jgi:glutamate synthase (NADPH/NADH) large chain
MAAQERPAHPGDLTDHGSASYDVDQLKQYMKMFQVTFEERDQVLRPLGEQG